MNSVINYIDCYINSQIDARVTARIKTKYRNIFKFDSFANESLDEYFLPSGNLTSLSKRIKDDRIAFTSEETDNILSQLMPLVDKLFMEDKKKEND